MQSTYVLLDIAKFVDFNRTQGVYHVIHIYFLNFFNARYNCAKFHHCRIRVKDFREGAFLFPQSLSSPEKAHPE